MIILFKQKEVLLTCYLGCCTDQKCNYYSLCNESESQANVCLFHRPQDMKATVRNYWKLTEKSIKWEGRSQREGWEWKEGTKIEQGEKTEAYWYETLKEALNDEVFKSTVTIGSVLSELHLPTVVGGETTVMLNYFTAARPSLFQKEILLERIFSISVEINLGKLKKKTVLLCNSAKKEERQKWRVVLDLTKSVCRSKSDTRSE